MSLSATCLKQHAKENAITKKWLLRGLLIAAGAHLGLIPLMAFIPAEVTEPSERIALVVTGPTEPIEPTEETVEEFSPQENVEALEAAIAQAELAAESQVSGGLSAAPPAPIASFQPAPEPPPAAKEPEPSDEPAEEPETEAATETAAGSPDQDAEEPAAADTPNSDDLESDKYLCKVNYRIRFSKNSKTRRFRQSLL